MSFFKDLFSSLSSNKTSEKPSQNTELLTNSAKRVIPSIADYSYRNTGLNTAGNRKYIQTKKLVFTTTRFAGYYQ